MNTLPIFGFILALFVGISLVLLGGGGPILTVPILTYLIGLEPQEAIASSLVIVGITSAFSLISHHRSRQVYWKLGLIFGASGMFGAFFGGLLGGFLPAAILMVLLAIMMIATAVAMMRKKIPSVQKTIPEESPPPLPLFRIIIDGTVVGFVTGLVGAGGGFLIVPALTLLAGLPMTAAVGTSLLIIALKSFAGMTGYLVSVQIDWMLVAVFSIIALIGAFIGSQFVRKISESVLRKGFSVFIILIGVIIAIQEVPKLLETF